MKKYIVCGVILFLCFFLVLFFALHPKSSEEKSFSLILHGDKVMHMKDHFVDPGYDAWDPIDGDLTNQVQVREQINYFEAGTYEVNYSVTNSRGETLSESRFVVLDVAVGYQYKKEYDLINNDARSWWSGNKKDHTRPAGGYSLDELKKYDATFLGPDEKVIYLTFDEGSNDTYVNEIVDVLNQNDVKATFFFCKKFILYNPELMKKIVSSGHSVGNHTANHVAMSEFANSDGYERFVREIKAVEEAFYEVTGTNLDKVYREPKGEWSLRSLAMIQDLGYSTYFYSADYLDWNGEVTKDYAYQELMKRYHNGAIYLLHPQNKGNYFALDSFIKDMKNLGYSFDLVKNIV